ncbi:FkbM family methyltransferase [Roseixanthobacter pseudopolyaromaticivorans]|uniref:FkbM family methyltransferase n=1 Tax=Xanthobacteraceae TaxID=335928 RepID=UPI003728DF71
MKNLDCRYGTVCLPSSADDIIGRFISYYGEWAWLESVFVSSIIQPGARILDLGAFIGTFTMGLAQQADLSFACLVEANPQSSTLLEANLKTNLSVPYRRIEALVAGRESLLTSGRADPSNMGGTSYLPDAEGETPVAPPPTVVTLDELVAEFGPFDLVKMDVEGMELDILRGSPSALTSEAVFWIECNEAPAVFSLAELLLTSGRPVWYFAWSAHNPNNYAGQVEPIFPYAYEAGLLVGVHNVALPEALKDAACILLRIESLVDLQRAMWRTPRWGEREWLDLPKEQLVGVLSHRSQGLAEDTFLISPPERLDVAVDLPDGPAVADSKTKRRVRRLEAALAEGAERHAKTVSTLALTIDDLRNTLVQMRELLAEGGRREAEAAGRESETAAEVRALQDRIIEIQVQNEARIAELKKKHGKLRALRKRIGL